MYAIYPFKSDDNLDVSLNCFEDPKLLILITPSLTNTLLEFYKKRL
jgi:hypothetical protein